MFDAPADSGTYLNKVSVFFFFGEKPFQMYGQSAAQKRKKKRALLHAADFFRRLCAS